MQAFDTDAELEAFLSGRAAHRHEHAIDWMAGGAPAGSAVASAPVAAAALRSPEASITNTQEAGVDEGGIVNTHGDHLVVLRRGRLFTIALGDEALRAVDRINAFPPGTSGRGTWYDEMLVVGDRVVVIGYSYERGGTEINRFRIDGAGRLRFEDSYQLRSSDYYSAGNYASRLIGGRLILYTPLLVGSGERPLDSLPAMRRWTGDPDSPFERLAPASRVYLPQPMQDDETADVDTLHTVTVCAVDAERLTCEATAVLGAYARSFYVSAEAAYVWIAGALGGGAGEPRAMVYRLPLDGSRPGAVQARGGPVDQFSFREDADRGILNVLVRAEGRGDAMWQGEVSAGEPALLSLSLTAFGDGSTSADEDRYRPLPLEPGANWSFHNRFVGTHLLYAASTFAAEKATAPLFVAPLDGGAVTRVEVQHGIDRIEAMGADAVVVGNDAGRQLGFTSIGLGAGGVEALDTSFLTLASEGERRSHAFFYRPDPGSADGASGMLGLPVSRRIAGGRLRRLLGSGSAIAFLRREDRHLLPVGELTAQPVGAMKDDAQVSGTDWYGNARPIFLRGRMLALMGYELVEGRVEDDGVVEIDRVDFLKPATLH